MPRWTSKCSGFPATSPWIWSGWKLPRASWNSKITERTTHLRASNERLKGQIRERRQAEDTLRRAQDELVQAGMSGRYQGLRDVALEYAFVFKVLGI